jgi:hypothetical protein
MENRQPDSGGHGIRGLDRHDWVQLAGCTRHRNCANCLRYALTWRAGLLDPSSRRPTRDFIQPALFDPDHCAAAVTPRG